MLESHGELLKLPTPHPQTVTYQGWDLGIDTLSFSKGFSFFLSLKIMDVALFTKDAGWGWFCQPGA